MKPVATEGHAQHSEAGARGRGRPQVVFTVLRTEWLTPHLVRVHLGGPAYDDFIANADAQRLGATDKYVKLLFARPDLGLEPPFDLDALREILAPDDMPVRRTYTIRSIDETTRSIVIDFVVHGEEGIAGPWAAGAVSGDTLALSGPGGGYVPTVDSETPHLFLGDDSAIPAIAAAIESLHSDAKGLALIEVDSTDDEIAITRPAGVEIRWIHRTSGGVSREHGIALVEAVHNLDVPTAAFDVFAHGERTAMRAIRAVLQDEWGLERRSLSLSAYWARGRAEDAFQAEKRTEAGQIFTD